MQTNKQTDFANQGDTISRQAAIYAFTHKWDGMVTSVFDVINSLPSAQPDALTKRVIEICKKIAPGKEPEDVIRYACINYSIGYEEGHEQGKKDAQPGIKQAAKLLSDFIENCPGGDSYLITPDGENLRTDWGYATEGIKLIHDWAERRTDG